MLFIWVEIGWDGEWHWKFVKGSTEFRIYKCYYNGFPKCVQKKKCLTFKTHHTRCKSKQYKNYDKDRKKRIVFFVEKLPAKENDFEWIVDCRRRVCVSIFFLSTPADFNCMAKNKTFDVDSSIQALFRKKNSVHISFLFSSKKIVIFREEPVCFL